MRSENVCHYLNEQGFKTVNMVGGMLQYEGENQISSLKLETSLFQFFSLHTVYKRGIGKWGLTYGK